MDESLAMGRHGAAGIGLDGRYKIGVTVALFAIGAITLVWNAYAGLNWEISWHLTIIIPLTALGISAALSMIGAARISRPRAIIIDVFFYVFVWSMMAVVFARLSYLAAALRLPLQDAALTKADAILGFDWWAYFRFSATRPWLMTVEAVVYYSFLWQWFVLIIVFSVVGRQERSRELSSSTLLATLLCIVISGVIPALGPGVSHGIQADWTGIVQEIRSGTHSPLRESGIVTFPSLHTAMAIMLTYASRGLKVFAPTLLMNFAMLFTIPVIGQHYLSDMLAGAVCAVIAISVAKQFLEQVDQPSPNAG